MAINSATLVNKSPACFHPLILSHSFTSRFSQQSVSSQPIFVPTPSKFASLRNQSSSISSRSSSISTWKGFVGSSSRFRDSGMKFVRVSAGTDSGSGGTGGSGGNFNGGGGGRGDEGFGSDDDSNSNTNSPVFWYLDLLAKFPVMTKAVTSAILTFIGDLICQLVVDKVPSVDYKRTFIFSFLGLVLVGPTLHFWYLYLSELITRPGASGAIMRLIFDQFVFSPVFLGVFLASLVTLEGRPLQVVPKLKQEWFSAVVANWQLWIPFQYFNFRFVPQQFQVLAANFLALLWNVILSYKAHKEVVTK